MESWIGAGAGAGAGAGHVGVLAVEGKREREDPSSSESRRAYCGKVGLDIVPVKQRGLALLDVDTHPAARQVPVEPGVVGDADPAACAAAVGCSAKFLDHLTRVDFGHVARNSGDEAWVAGVAPELAGEDVGHFGLASGPDDEWLERMAHAEA